MSLRNFKIYSNRASDGTFSLLVESTKSCNYLLIQSGVLLELDADNGDSLKKNYQKVADGYAILGIINLGDGDAYLLLITSVLSVGQLYECDVYKINDVQFIPLQWEFTENLDTRAAEVQRLLSAGVFYYAYSVVKENIFDLTQSAQRRSTTTAGDDQFFWNRNLCFLFKKYNIASEMWVAKCMCGSVSIRTIYVAHLTSKVAIISRLSCERIGTRFNVRGADDEGNVANFVETEQLITFEDTECSFVQIRGSVPLFWEQPGVQVGAHKVRLKPVEISMSALEAHYTALKTGYGDIVTVNLLGSKEGERTLSNAFELAVKNSMHSALQFISFDYHAQMKTSKSSINGLLKQLIPKIESHKFFLKSDRVIYELQTGCIRTNCLDCLDRTNSVQTLLGLKVLTAQLGRLEMEKKKSKIELRFEEVMKDLWQKNGDQCSVIYTGTGALEGKSKLRDASRSLARTIQNNLMDTSKQESFDLLLFGRSFGNIHFDQAANILKSKVIRECPYVLEELVSRRKEMIDTKSLKVFCGTWNVNGGKNVYNVAFRHEQSLESWLFPELRSHFFKFFSVLVTSDPYDIVAIGLEEIVDLNAGNIVKASTTNQRIWKEGIKQTLEAGYNGSVPYVVLSSEQLCGVCLIIYVRIELLPRIRELSVQDVKTGLGGATGNKGSVAARLTVDSTSICFLCSHFAAGQNEVASRNEDFATVLRKMRFQQGRQVQSHDVIIWLGDFNYRINLSGDDVKAAVRATDYPKLLENDQLSQQRRNGNVFQDFIEGSLNFAPTYKYDTFSDDYDTSEKCRAPAWTDRILYRTVTELPADLIHYGRAELKTSDHRPVMAVFQLSVCKIDPIKCHRVLDDIASTMGPPDSTVMCSISEHSQFPNEYICDVYTKLDELMVVPQLHKIEGRYLHLIMPSGMEAVAALSLNNVTLRAGIVIEAKLRSENWQTELTKRFENLLIERPSHQNTLRRLATLNIPVDDDDESWEKLDV